MRLGNRGSRGSPFVPQRSSCCPNSPNHVVEYRLRGPERARHPTKHTMNVTFHALTAVGIAHIAAIRLEPSGEGWFYRSDVWVLGSAFTLGVLSHGVLDGLKHGYPIQTAPDVLCASVLAIGWCMCAHRRYFLLFASVSLGSFAPDIVDHGPPLLGYRQGPREPIGPIRTGSYHRKLVPDTFEKGPTSGHRAGSEGLSSVQPAKLGGGLASLCGVNAGANTCANLAGATAAPFRALRSREQQRPTATSETFTPPVGCRTSRRLVLFSVVNENRSRL